MPPVSPQGSRGGLIAAVVIFTIWSVAATIFAIYNTVALSKAGDENKTLVAKSQTYYQDTTGGTIDWLISNRNMVSDAQLPDHSVLTVAAHYEDLLSQAIQKTGTPTTDPTVAIDSAHQAVANANAKLSSLNIPADADLVTSINTLTDYAGNEKKQADSMTTAMGDEGKQFTAQIQADADEIKQLHTKVDAMSAQVKEAQDRVTVAERGYTGDVTKESQEFDKDRQGWIVKAKDYEATIAAKDKMIADTKSDLNDAMLKISSHRPNPEGRMLQKSVGKIDQVASDGVVYINIGRSEHVSPGMTFEVYDQRQGVPPSFDPMSTNDMPVGLGSIEVEHVDPNASQCRVIKMGVAGHMDPGDVIANLVYDRNTTYNFVVYGSFDLAHNGRPTPLDAKKIESLIRQWGGKVRDKLDVQTDFVVMGAIPKVETFTEDEKQDPFIADTLKKEQAEYDNYNAILDKARELHIPPLNQNRFLYLIGYYDASQR